jgi:hypothetical protein
MYSENFFVSLSTWRMWSIDIVVLFGAANDKAERTQFRICRPLSALGSDHPICSFRRFLQSCMPSLYAAEGVYIDSRLMKLHGPHKADLVCTAHWRGDNARISVKVRWVTLEPLCKHVNLLTAAFRKLECWESLLLQQFLPAFLCRFMSTLLNRWPYQAA